jgi:protein subunit release factor A
MHQLPDFLEGDLDPMIEPLVSHYQAEKLQQEAKAS